MNIIRRYFKLIRLQKIVGHNGADYSSDWFIQRRDGTEAHHNIVLCPIKHVHTNYNTVIFRTFKSILLNDWLQWSSFAASDKWEI